MRDRVLRRAADESRRVESVLDAWFDSGAMPASQFHYPFEDEDTFARRFPADFICEAIDQTRGWFYSLLAVNTLVFDRSPYRNVVCLALLVDRDGYKMSKSRGNVIDPWSILDTRGADALRWYFFSAGSPWTSRRVDEQMIDESTRRFLLTLWNTYSFFVTYARLDGWEPRATIASAPTHVLDRWVRSRLHSTVARRDRRARGLRRAPRRRRRWSRSSTTSRTGTCAGRVPRFWKSADPARTRRSTSASARSSLLLAPLCPFLTDELWTNLGGTGESVHLADWPDADAAAIDRALERERRRPPARW